MKGLIKIKGLDIYLFAFIEGILVMCFELIVVRLISPYFGNSLYAFTSVVGITMLTLLIGYYFGGVIVSKNKHQKYVLLFILIVSCILCLITIFSPPILRFSISMGLISGSIFAVAMIIALPLILLGSISPQLIQQLSELNEKAGIASGNVYAISTLGGVFGTFVLGLLFIPTIGVKMSSLIFGIAAAMIALIIIVIKKIDYQPLLLFFLLISSAAAGFTINNDIKKNNNLKLIYNSDGFMGKLEVFQTSTNSRVLMNNGTSQSVVNNETKKSMHPYNHVIATVASAMPPKQRDNVAIIGMAAGSLVGEMQNLNFKNIYAIDIDKRSKNIAEKYFGIVPNSYTFIADDGRHFLYETSLKFNVIIIDVSISEQQPYHLYTQEAFALYKSKLHDDGFIILNIIDLIDLNKGKIIEKIGDGMLINQFKTYLVRDFYPDDTPNKDAIEAIAHERVIIGAKGNINNMSTLLSEMNDCCKIELFNQALKQTFVNMTFQKKEITSKPFVDDCPEMDKLNFERINLLRTKYLN